MSHYKFPPPLPVNGPFIKARILPAKAVEMLREAAMVEDPKEREKAVNKAISDVKHKYPRYFRED